MVQNTLRLRLRLRKHPICTAVGRQPQKHPEDIVVLGTQNTATRRVYFTHELLKLNGQQYLKKSEFHFRRASSKLSCKHVSPECQRLAFSIYEHVVLHGLYYNVPQTFKAAKWCRPEGYPRATRFSIISGTYTGIHFPLLNMSN